MEAQMKDDKAEMEESLPQHVAIIMDGNGRWAKRKGDKRVFGHQNAIQLSLILIYEPTRPY